VPVAMPIAAVAAVAVAAVAVLGRAALSRAVQSMAVLSRAVLSRTGLSRAGLRHGSAIVCWVAVRIGPFLAGRVRRSGHGWGTSAKVEVGLRSRVARSSGQTVAKARPTTSLIGTIPWSNSG
jgi:hypothetical protein